MATGIIALSLIAAACGSDDDDAGGDTTTPSAESTEAPTTTAGTEETTADSTADTTADTTEATTADTAAPAEDDGTVVTFSPDPAEGDAIKVMSLGTFEGSTNPSFGNLPEVKAAVSGYFAWLNDHGGINGQPVELIECNDQANPDVAATCARQAVDEGVAVVISPWHSANGTTIVPILEGAGIPFINGPLSPPDFTSPISFTVGSGASGAFGATAIGMIELVGCEKPGVFAYDVAASQAIVQSMKNAVTPLGVELGVVTINPAASNFADVVAELQNTGYDCMMSVIAPNQLLPLMTAIQSAGLEIQFGGYAASWTADQFQTLSSLGAEGGVYSSQFVNPDTVSPSMDQVREVWAEHDVPMTQFTQSSWVMSALFTKIAAELDEVTAANVLDGLNKADGIELGLIPTYSTQNPITAAGYTRIFSPFAYLSLLTDGVLIPANDGEPVDASVAYGQ